MTAPRVLLNVGNLRSGGGLQVGASFLDEVARLAGTPVAAERWPWLASDTVVEASPEVMANCTADVGRVQVRTVDGSPWSAVRRGLGRGRPYDVTFTLFGPDYSRRRSARRIIGFADVTSAFPEETMRPGGALGAARAALRRLVSRKAFLAADRIVVESPHIVDELRTGWGVSAPISVVSNVVNAVFRDEAAQEDVTLPEIGSPALFFPTRAYPHKNLPFLGAVGRELLRSHGVRATFVLTLTDAEWEGLPADVREFSITVGPLRVGQLPALYRAVDAAIFPSLLESQSVTPLEALATGCPLAASDRPFVRSAVGEAAWYFDPHDPVSAAGAVQGLLTDSPERERRRRLGLDLMASWPTASDRAAAYLDLVSEELAVAEATASR
jgi:glycosyltransferase involved in cell wall biosynthesis